MYQRLRIKIKNRQYRNFKFTIFNLLILFTLKKIIHLFFTLLISQSVFAKNHDRIAVNSSANRLPKTIKVLPPKSTKTFVALPPITTNKPFITKRSVINSNVSVTNQLACTPLGASPGNVNITWTGLISDDWNTPCNWNPAWVPDVSNAKAIIPYNATNPPIISGTVPDVNSIDINLKGLLTINTGGTLNIRENGGTNNGIKIDGGQLNNVGTINIESTSNTAIDAYIYLTSGTSTDNSGLVNQGTIKINSTDEAIGVGIGGGGTGFAFIVNEATGIINIVDGIGVEVASQT